MKILVIYDFVFGNTEKIARAIGSAHEAHNDVLVLQVNALRPEHLQGVELLIVGSPTRGFRATEAMTAFLKGLASQALAGVGVAAFDTRLSLVDEKSAFVRFIVRKGGYAAKPIAEHLVKRGGVLVLPPEGFLVTGEQGPLKAGELERAAGWAISLEQVQAG